MPTVLSKPALDDGWTSAQLGRHPDSLDLLFLELPHIASETDAKANAYDYAVDVLSPYGSQFGYNDISTVLSNLTPGNCTTARAQAVSYGRELRSCSHDIRYLQGDSFQDHEGNTFGLFDLSEDPSQRAWDIARFRINASIDPNICAPEGVKIDRDPLAFSYCLDLPQTKFMNDLDDTSFAESALVPRHTLFSPRMKHAVLDTSDNGKSTFGGDLDILRDQETFAKTFPLQTFSGKDAKQVSTILDDFVNECQLQVFFQLLRLDYVGTSDRADVATIQSVTSKLRDLSMHARDQKTLVSESPSVLFNGFLTLTSQLPPETSSWGMSLAHQYYSALTPECRKEIEISSDYKLPDPATLQTKNLQLSALRTIRSAAVAAHERDEKDFSKAMKFHAQYGGGRKTVNTFIQSSKSPLPPAPKNPPRTSGLDTLAAAANVIVNPPQPSPPTAQSFHSPAERTIQKYTPGTARPGVVLDPTGKFPVNPTTGYQSKYSTDFTGCLGCGESSHNHFRECPHRNVPATKQVFFKELYAHIPKLRIASEQRQAARDGTPAPVQPSPQQVPAQAPAQTAGSMVQHAQYPPIQPQTAWYPSYPTAYPNPYSPSGIPLPPVPPPLNSHGYSPYPPATKKTRFLVSKTRSHSYSGAQSKPAMPIAIDNGFPSLTLSIGSSNGDSVELTGLLDTCGSLNTGLDKFHFYIASKYPDLVDDLRHFNASDPFEPIKLEGAVTNPDSFDASAHGLLTAVIRYRTSYRTTDDSAVFISFALGPNVSVNTIIGLPSLSAFRMNIDLHSFTAYSPVINRSFELARSCGRLGLPDNTKFTIPDLQQLHESRPQSISPSLVAIDDHSQGYFRRSVVPSSLRRTDTTPALDTPPALDTH